MRLKIYKNGQPIGTVNVPDDAFYDLTVAALPDAPTLCVIRLRVWMQSAHVTFDVSPYYSSTPEALIELDRIAALISGETAPAQGWVKGPPPKDGRWYIVFYECDEIGHKPCVAQWDADKSTYLDDHGSNYATDITITHHLPTPIQPPKES